MILYFHGFASAGGGPKYQMLKDRFGNRTEVYSPDLPVNPIEVTNVVREHMQKHLSDITTIFVGSSLGGFYAAEARASAHIELQTE